MSTLFTPNVKVITKQSQTKELFKGSVPSVLNLSIIHVFLVPSVLTVFIFYPSPLFQIVRFFCFFLFLSFFFLGGGGGGDF